MPPELVQHPSAAVSPLRTKKAEPQHDTRFGSPFVSPIRTDEIPRYDNPLRMQQATELETRPISSIYNQPLRRSSSDFDMQAQRASEQYAQPGEVLTPRRYEVEASKRDTTFTTLMKHCGIPDPGNMYPSVPPVPKQYKGQR
jgi:hypothetical protein